MITERRAVWRALTHHIIITAYARGWDKLTNGALLKAAEDDGVALLLTTDGRMRYQQNLKERKIAIVVLTHMTKWARVRLHLHRITAAVDATTPGSYVEAENSDVTKCN